MKKFLLSVIAVFALQSMMAQYYYVPNTLAGQNPSGINSDMENPFPNAANVGWTTLWSGNNSSVTAYASEQTIPFAFMFNGAAVTKYTAGNFGTVAFDAGTPAVKPSSFSNLTLPNANIPDNSVNVLGIKPQNQGSGSTAVNSAIMSKTFGTSPHRQHWIWFNFFGEPNIQSGWTYWGIVLEEGTNNIYVVDMHTICVTATSQFCSSNVKLSIGIQLNSTTAITVANSPNTGAASPQLTKQVWDASDNGYYQFIQGTQPANDVVAMKVNSPYYLILGQAPFTIGADLRNIGTSKVLSADMNYSIDGGAKVTAPASGVAINPLATQAVNHPTQWTPSGLGLHTIKVWASNINGSADGHPENDTAFYTVNVVSNFVARVILNEVFTSSTCGPCVAGNINYKNVTDAKDQSKFTTVKYQMYYPGTGDPYYTAEAGTRHTFYGINSIPRMEVDGGWNVNAQSFSSALFDQFQAKPSFMEVTGTSTFKFKTISITANIKPLTNITSTSLYLFAAVCEKVTTKNVKTNGETEFDHVMKKMVPNANGTLLTGLTKDVTTTKNLSFTFPGAYTLAPSGASPINVNTNHSIEEFSDLEVVLWVQDIATKEVWQSGYTTHSLLGIDKQYSSVQNIQVIPNPTNGLTKVNFALNEDNNIQVVLVDALGKTVKTFTKEEFTSGYNSFTFDVTDMATGVYFIKFNGDNFSTTQKFVVR